MAKNSGGTRQGKNNASEEGILKNEFRRDVLQSEGFAEIERNSDYYKGSRTALAKEVKGLYKEAVETIKDTISKMNLESVKGLYDAEIYYREQLSSLNTKIDDKIEALRYNVDRGFGNKKRAEQVVIELSSLARNIDVVRKEAISNDNLPKLEIVLSKKGKWK